MKHNEKISRRDFLKLSALTVGGLAVGRGQFGRGGKAILNRIGHLQEETPPSFPENQWLGRMCIGEPGANVPMLKEPNAYADEVRKVYFDEVLPWNREVFTNQLDMNRIKNRWVETPEGYIYANYLQKVRHVPQQPMTELPTNDNGDTGMWVEIVTPYSPLELTKDKNAYLYWIRETIRPRIYYSQVFWAFDVRQDPETGRTQYCLMQKVPAIPDTYWVDATYCRRITPEETAPIHPDAGDKRIVVDIDKQIMLCYEGDKEVYYAKITSGGWNSEENKWLTPIGIHTIWRKSLSIHMSASEAVGNYDIPGIPWSTLFDVNGAAIHSTFWHNYFGSAGRSHGCVNAKPEDAKWVWRWSNPPVDYAVGDLFIQGMNKSTTVEIRAE
ncbi:L,D-transpeptidase family protein [bacterium]|nr:L,D-transpeptidase family protein [bacterium]